MKVIKRQRTEETKLAVKRFEEITGYDVLEATKLSGKNKDSVRFLVEIKNSRVLRLGNHIKGLWIRSSRANPENLSQSYLDVRWTDLGIEI